MKMNYFSITAVLIIAFLFGIFSVDKFEDDKSVKQLSKPSHKVQRQPKLLNLQPQKIEYNTINETNIENKTVNEFYFPHESSKVINSPDDSKSETSKLENFTSTSKSIVYRTSHSKTNNLSQNKHTAVFNSSLITFQSIGTKLFIGKSAKIPGIYTFFHLNIKKKPISLKWIISYEESVFTRTVNYSSTKEGNNRAVIFIDRKMMATSGDSDDTFLSKLKVRLTFIIDGKEFSFPKANIGHIKPIIDSIKQSPKILKARSEIKLKLSENYNPITQ